MLAHLREVWLEMPAPERTILRCIISGILFATVGCMAQPYFEARTFNKFSSVKATYWDAMFGSLRVIAEK